MTTHSRGKERDFDWRATTAVTGTRKSSVNSSLRARVRAAPYGYLDWAATAGWAALGNMIGGIALVTLLRMLQVPHEVLDNARNPAPCVEGESA